MGSLNTGAINKEDDVQKIRAFVSWSFFEQLLPYSGKLLNGNGMLLQACGQQSRDGSVIRSKEFLLFGNGIATLILWAKTASLMEKGEGYVMEFTEKLDCRKVRYWEVQSVGDQQLTSGNWCLTVSDRPPDDCAIDLIGQPGAPGQFFFLS